MGRQETIDESLWGFDGSGWIEGAPPWAGNYIVHKADTKKTYQLYCQFCYRQLLTAVSYKEFVEAMRKFFPVKRDEFWGLRLTPPAETKAQAKMWGY